MTNNYNILILVKSPSEAERIISIFRNEKLSIRAHRITSREDFDEHLPDNQWDIIIADNRHPDISLPSCLELISNQSLDIPVILLSSDLSTENKKQMIKLGIIDIIDKNEPLLFLHAAKREMINSQIRKSKIALESEFNELKQRANKLLTDSSDAIAYISDGILIDSNLKFAELLGYQDPDDLDCASFIDMLIDKDKEVFKQFFRVFSKNEDTSSTGTFSLLTANNIEAQVSIVLKPTTLDGEDCVQINLTPNSKTDKSTASRHQHNSSIDNITSLSKAFDRLTITQDTTKNCFLVIKVNNFINLRKKLLVSGSWALIDDLSCHINQRQNNLQTFSLSDDCLAFIFPGSTEEGLEFSNQICQSLDSHIFEYDTVSLPYTATCHIFKLPESDLKGFIELAVEATYNSQSSDKNIAATISLKSTAAEPVNLSSTNVEEIINHNNFELLFQPIMSLQGSENENYEVTFRLKTNLDINLILTDSSLDRWLIIEATKILSLHRANGHNTRIFVNLSKHVLNDASFPSWVKVALKASNLPINAIIFQVDEFDMTNNLKGAINLYQSLISNDHLVSIKNVGTSEALFKILNHFKPHFISFKASITEDMNEPDELEKLKAVLNQLNEMSIDSLLTNISNASELAYLWPLGVKYIMGSYLQNPTTDMSFDFSELN